MKDLFIVIIFFGSFTYTSIDVSSDFIQSTLATRRLKLN